MKNKLVYNSPLTSIKHLYQNINLKKKGFNKEERLGFVGMQGRLCILLKYLQINQRFYRLFFHLNSDHYGPIL